MTKMPDSIREMLAHRRRLGQFAKVANAWPPKLPAAKPASPLQLHLTINLADGRLTSSTTSPPTQKDGPGSVLLFS